MTNVTDKMDPRILRTRRLLRDAFIVLVPEKGFDSLTIQDLTDQATLNRATFYLHYRDKNELLDDVFEALIQDINPLLNASGEQTMHDPYQMVPRIAMMLDHIAAHDDFYRSMLGTQGVSGFAARVQTYIEKVLSAWLNVHNPEETQQKVNAEIAVHYVGSAYLGVISWWLEHDRPVASEHLATQLMHLTALGLHQSLGIPITVQT
jgi:AcrR family transcriptional regulator